MARYQTSPYTWLGEPGNPRHIFLGGTGGIEALVDPSVTQAVRDSGRVAFYAHSAVWSGPNHIDKSLEEKIAANFAGTGPATIEVGFRNKNLWTDIYPKYYRAIGINAIAANVDVFVSNVKGEPGGIANVHIPFEDWKAYVDAARADGVKVVAPITGFVSGLGANGSGPFRGPFGSDGQIRPEILAEYQKMAEYGGGIAIDDPVNFVYWQYPAFQRAIVSLIKWAKDRHLSAELIISPGGVKQPSGKDFKANTRRIIDFLAAQDALPTDFVVENYLAPGPVPPNYINTIAPDRDPNTAAGVALWLANYLPATAGKIEPSMDINLDSAVVAKGLAAHDRAVHITTGWIRDPYIILAPDGFYYLTGTTPNPNDPREKTEPYEKGLSKTGIVGGSVRVWRSRDLTNWESLGSVYSAPDGYWYQQNPAHFAKQDTNTWKLWAPELHFYNDRWFLVYVSPSPALGSNLAVTKGPALTAPWENPLGEKAKGHHDPSLFRDTDGRIWLIWAATFIEPLKSDFSDFTAPPLPIAPSDRKIGHEGCTILKIGSKYVLFGTGWSTDKLRKGTYNLYYCTADKITGPYGPRRFVGRFLGHGTPFQDKGGRWWCTAFFNANRPPLSPEEVRGQSMDDAYTINPQGVTLVPLDVQTLANGDVSVRAIDPDYATPGPDEVQKFNLN